MNSKSEPPLKKKKNLNPSLSLFSLPDDIVLNCVARIPLSYYPKLSLVSKTFASLISSHKLKETRFLQKRYEKILHVCFHFPTKSDSLSWYSLWLKPNQPLTNDLEKKEMSTGNALLVPIPSSYCRRPPTFVCKVGSEYYAINRYGLLVTKSGTGNWRKVPNMMTVARGEDAIAGVLDGKIYVMGGCSMYESKHWAEVYDTKTQTWESLPDPGFYLRFSTLMKMEVRGEDIYVKASKDTNLYVYDTKEGKWEDVIPMFESSVVIENVRYRYLSADLIWYSEKHNGWRRVNGLSVLERHCRRGSGNIEMVNYGGKLLMIWDEFVCGLHRHEKTNIWCALIAFERRNGDEEVWGNVEWANSVLTVPISCVLLRHVIQAV
ncbi:hypothetical protein Bca52824_002478 [Brassica carinata]|uniref:F-box domain-containing protein n=1 Tax=Brassica carinata TaxID=52824 RepID=A0A8X8BEC1_BRACI|nr:hypothetical protein Bca52824_002478 [Brassica carinata]